MAYFKCFAPGDCIDDRIDVMTSGLNTCYRGSAMRAELTQSEWDYCITVAADNIQYRNCEHEPIFARLNIMPEGLDPINDVLGANYYSDNALRSDIRMFKTYDSDGLEIPCYQRFVWGVMNTAIQLPCVPIFPTLDDSVLDEQRVKDDAVLRRALVRMSYSCRETATHKVNLLETVQITRAVIDTFHRVGIDTPDRFQKYMATRVFLSAGEKMLIRGGSFSNLIYFYLMLQTKSHIKDGILFIRIVPSYDCDVLNIWSAYRGSIGFS